MATLKLKYGSTTESYWNSSSKITTPSGILTKGSSTVYIPINDLKGVFKVTIKAKSGFTLSATTNTSSKKTSSASVQNYSFTVTGTKT